MSETDILLAELFNSNVETYLQIFFGFVSATSAFLIVAHSTAREMPRALASVAVTLYTVTSIVLIAGTSRQGLSIVGIRSQLKQIDALHWHPAVYAPDWLAMLNMYGMVIIEFFLFLGAVWYFLHARKQSTP